MIVLGFSGIADGDFYLRNYGLRFVGHDSAVALVRDGQAVFAVEEERLSRQKHTSALPVHAIRAALSHAGLHPSDVDAVAYPWNATAPRIAHMFLYHPTRIPIRHWPALGLTGCRVLSDLMSPRRAVRDLETALGERFVRASRIGVPHHRSHAACAFLGSGFREAAVLTVDGQGEDESASLGHFEGGVYRKLQVTHSPDSIGLLYAMVTDFLGMRSAWDEYKVMGMARLGDPLRYKHVFDRLVTLLPAGRYRTKRTAMIFMPGYMPSSPGNSDFRSARPGSRSVGSTSTSRPGSRPGPRRSSSTCSTVCERSPGPETSASPAGCSRTRSPTGRSGRAASSRTSTSPPFRVTTEAPWGPLSGPRGTT